MGEGGEKEEERREKKAVDSRIKGGEGGDQIN